MTLLRRALVGLLATSVAATGLALAAAAPARATVATVDAGAPISRSEIVERALSWTTQRVPYSETLYFPAAAPRTGVGHSYRQDCSGFLSMAWDLSGSAVTTSFVSATSPYDRRLPSYAALQRGDMLGISGHVVLFLGWSADDAGRHRYFDMVSEAHTGTVATVNTDQDLDGYWHTYAPYSYRLAAADTPATTAYGAGRTEQATLAPDGHVLLGWRTTGQTTWNTTDLTATERLPILRTAPALVSPAAGALVLIGTGQSGALIAFTGTAAGWSARTLTATGTVYGIAASASGGRVDVVGRQVGATAGDGTGTLLHATLVGTTWSGWQRPGTAPPSVIGDPAVTSGTGVVDTVVESAAGTLLYGTWATAGSAWSWSAPFGSSRVSSPPAASRLPDGTVVVAATIDGALRQDSLAPGSGTWTGWQAPAASLAAMSTLVVTGTAPVLRSPPPRRSAQARAR